MKQWFHIAVRIAWTATWESWQRLKRLKAPVLELSSSRKLRYLLIFLLLFYYRFELRAVITTLDFSWLPAMSKEQMYGAFAMAAVLHGIRSLFSTAYVYMSNMPRQQPPPFSSGQPFPVPNFTRPGGSGEIHGYDEEDAGLREQAEIAATVTNGDVEEIFKQMKEERIRSLQYTRDEE